MDIGIVCTYLNFSKILGFLSIFIMIFGVLLECVFILIDLGIWLIEKAKMYIQIRKVERKIEKND